MGKIKTLVVNTAGMRRNGMTQVLYDYYSRFDMDSFEIHCISCDGEPNEVRRAFSETGCYVHTIASRRDNPILYARDLYRICRRKSFDIIHVNGSSATMAIELLVGLVAGIPCRIAHAHSSSCDAQKADKLLRPLFNRTFTEPFACCDLAGKWMYGEHSYTVIKNGRAIDKFSYKPLQREAVRQKLGLLDGEIAIGHVGNFNEPKNHKFLVKVFDELHKKRRNSKLFLAGYGHCEDAVQETVRQLGLQDVVFFLGVVDNVEELLQAMDVMLLPSMHEGLPLVVVEWQLAALPCLVSDRVTEECAFSDLVKFKSLEAEASEWAADAIQLTQRDRNEDAKTVLESARRSGYDLDADVEMLMQKFRDLVQTVE